MMNRQNNGIQKWIGRIIATVISGVAIAFLTGRINLHKALFLATSWISGERDRAYFYIEPDIYKVELYFEQTR
jgi:hypothetical protein